MSRQSSPAGLHNESATLAERVVTLGSTSTVLTKETHANRLLILDTAAHATATYTLPHADGSGDTFEFLLTVPHTSGSILIDLDHGVSSNIFNGTAFMSGSGSVLATFSASSGLAADRITLNNTTTGGQRAGDYIKLRDSAVGTWQVEQMFLTASGSTATPFSAP